MAVTLHRCTQCSDRFRNRADRRVGQTEDAAFGTVGSPGTAGCYARSRQRRSALRRAAPATANAITSDTNATGNASAVATATLETSGGTVVIHCAVAASSSDINMSNGLTVAAGDTVSCSSLTHGAVCLGLGKWRFR